MTNWTMRITVWMWASWRRAGALMIAMGCASAGTLPESSAPAPLTFADALAADSATFDPPRDFRAQAEPDWPRTAVSGPPRPGARIAIAGSSWRLDSACIVRLEDAADALAAGESAPVPTRRLNGERCHGQGGFWQERNGGVFLWRTLAGGWGAEYYGVLHGDTGMTLRRYAMKRTAPRTWRVERGTVTALHASRIPDVVVTSPRRATYEVTRALRAVGETDWATRPGAGTGRALGGTRWRDGAGCVLSFGTDLLARGTSTQRLTRGFSSASCGGLRGSWQQVGKPVFWRLNVDSTTASETYAEIVSDTLMRARHFDLRRASARDTWQATWVPTQSRTLLRLRR